MSKGRDAQAMAQALLSALKDFGDIPIEMKYSSNADRAFNSIVMVVNALEEEVRVEREKEAAREKSKNKKKRNLEGVKTAS